MDSNGKTLVLVRVGLLMVATLLFSSCATTWTEEQRQSITTVMVKPAVVSKEAYVEPRAVSPITAGSYGLVGALVVAGVEPGFQAHFDNKYEELIKVVNRNKPKRLGAKLRSDFISELKDSVVYGPRIAKRSPNLFTITIVKYGIAKTIDEKGMSPYLGVEFEFETPTGEPEWKDSFYLVGEQINPEPIKVEMDTYKNNPSLLSEHFGILAEEIARLAYNSFTGVAH